MVRRPTLALLVGVCCAAACGGRNVVSTFSVDAEAAPGFFVLDAAMPTGGRVVVGLDAAGAGLGCAADTIRAELLPIDLYFMVDISGSMADTTAGGQTKLDALRSAMTAFVNDRRSAGLGVGLQYFPQARPNVPAQCTTDTACGNYGPCDRIRTCWPARQVEPCRKDADCGSNRTCVPLGSCPGANTLCAVVTGGVCQNGTSSSPCQPLPGSCAGHDTCDAAAYGTPAVAVAPLPGSARSVTQSLMQAQAGGQTPTGPALAGALAHARTLAARDANRRVVVVLATDGLPMGCSPSDIPGIAAVAAQSLRDAPRVPTFVLGVFAPEERATASANLDAIARAGGTGRAHIVSTTQAVTQDLIAALNTVRAAALACQYGIPQPAQGTLDYGKVNVQFVTGRGGIVDIGKVRDAAACRPDVGGWYYDVEPGDAGVPTRILTCPSTCGDLQGDPGGRVDIVLGCETRLIE